MSEINFTKHAMNVLRIEMNADSGPGSYRDGWVANLACCIHDAVNSEPYNIGTDEDPEWIGEPLDASKMEDCNLIAERFIRMAFPPKDD